MNKLYLTCFFVIFISTLAAITPKVSSAGIVERELEKEYEKRPFDIMERMPPVQIDIPEEKLEFPEGKKVFIREVVVSGNESIATHKILSCLDQYLGKEFSIEDIYKLCIFIDQIYTKRSYFLTRAYPPPQTIDDGILQIEIIEGKLGKIEVVGNQYYSDAYIRSYFASLQFRPLKYDEFLRALLLLNENCDLFVGAVFRKGDEFGTADVILNVEDNYPAHLYLNANNYGRNLTTNTRVGGRLDWGNFFKEGDLFSIAEVVGFPVNALYFTDINYAIPLNRKGTFLEADYLTSRFKIEELKALDLSGRSNIATLRISHAVVRKRSLSVDFFSYFDYKQIQNFVFSHTSSFDKLRILNFGFFVDYYDSYQGRNYLNCQVAFGIPSFLGGLKTHDNKSSRPGAGGRFFILNADYDRLQLLPKDTFFYFHASGQWSPNKLTLPEVIYIGGDNTVRGFPLAIALGDSGFYFNCEYRFPPPFFGNKMSGLGDKTWKELMQFDVFLDQGSVFQKSSRSTTLWGTGLGVRILGPYNFSFSIDVGFPLNHRKETNSAFVYIKLTSQPF